MALHTKIGNVVPSDAVRLSREDALKFQSNMIYSWKSFEDSFFLKQGPAIMGGITSISAMYFNFYFRNRLHLMHHARLSTYLPVVIVPSFVALFLHTKYVTDSVMLEEFNCSVCLEMRAVTAQMFGGILYPGILAPMTSFWMAARHHTYNVPDISKDPKSVWNLYKKFAKKNSNVFLGIIGLNAIVAALITNAEVGNMYKIKRKLLEWEQEMGDNNY